MFLFLGVKVVMYTLSYMSTTSITFTVLTVRKTLMRPRDAFCCQGTESLGKNPQTRSLGSEHLV